MGGRPFPDNGSDEDHVRGDLDGYLGEDVSFGDGVILGSMCTDPHPLAVEAHSRFLNANLGNSGLVPGTKDMRNHVLDWTASLLGGRGLMGRFLSGGTEANITGLWYLRDLAWKKNGWTDRRLVLCAPSAHFSVRKAVDLLGLEYREIPMDESFRMDPSGVARAIQEYGSSILAVVCSAGTTELGVVDPISDISDILPPEIPIHVDAAFGGMVLPFLPGKRDGWDLDVERVFSIGLDYHKMGMSTIPSSVLVTRVDGSCIINYDAPYLTKPKHDTVLGTRASASVAATYAVVKHLGRSGYTSVVARCMDTTGYLVERMLGLGLEPVIEPTMNVVSFGMPDPKSIELALREKGYYVSTTIRPPGLRFVLMPHISNEHIDAFIPVLADVLGK